MKNNELLDKVKNKNTIIIFGYDLSGIYLKRILLDEKNKVFFCDNSKAKQGKKGNIIIYSVEEAAKIRDAVFVITSKAYQHIMTEQLQMLGVSDDRIIWGRTDELDFRVREENKLHKYKPLDMLQFEVDIVQHCNLDCKCCSQFSCIAEEEYVDINIFERDFKRLSELFNRSCKRIYLIGGEPLLHPRINDCIRIARKYFEIGEISIFTNGILLLNQKDDFWKCCRENNVSIIVTKYPIAINHEAMIEKAKVEKVKFEFFGSSDDFKYMVTLGLDIDGTQDIESAFTNCVEANNCIKLKDGKLYTCTRPAAIKKFNSFFDMNLKVTDADYIDIYDDLDKSEVLERLAKPIPFCKYCNNTGDKKALKWGKTSRRIDEWM